MSDVLEMATLYYQRDIDMKLDFNKTFTHAMNKLGYSPESMEKNVLNEYKCYCTNLIEIEKDQNFERIIPRKSFEEFKESIFNKTNSNNTRRDELSNFADKHEKFYKQLTINELTHLGY